MERRSSKTSYVTPLLVLFGPRRHFDVVAYVIVQEGVRGKRPVADRTVEIQSITLLSEHWRTREWWACTSKQQIIMDSGKDGDQQLYVYG